GSVAADVWSVVVGDVGVGGCAVSESVVLGRWFAGGAGSVGKSGRCGVVRAGGGAGSGCGDGSGGAGVAVGYSVWGVGGGRWGGGVAAGAGLCACAGGGGCGGGHLCVVVVGASVGAGVGGGVEHRGVSATVQVGGSWASGGFGCVSVRVRDA